MNFRFSKFKKLIPFKRTHVTLTFEENNPFCSTIYKFEKSLLVLSAAQYSQVIRIFDMFTSCYKTLSDQLRNNFITFRVISLNVLK